MTIRLSMKKGRVVRTFPFFICFLQIANDISFIKKEQKGFGNSNHFSDPARRGREPNLETVSVIAI